MQSTCIGVCVRLFNFCKKSQRLVNKDVCILADDILKSGRGVPSITSYDKWFTKILTGVGGAGARRFLRGVALESVEVEPPLTLCNALTSSLSSSTSDSKGFVLTMLLCDDLAAKRNRRYDKNSRISIINISPLIETKG